LLSKVRHHSAIRLALAAAALSAVVGCGDVVVGPTPVPFTPLPPLSTPVPAPTNGAIQRPTLAPSPPPWPAGWDDEFCAAFIELAIVHELAVDIPRALDEDETDDALALARELRSTAIAAGELLDELTPWETAQPAAAEMVTLADIGSRVGRQYVRYLDEGRRPALRRVEELLDDMRPVVEEANAELAQLASLGLACPPHALEFEIP
jgi:hypothetical protein